MPQASEELRAKFPGSDAEAWAVLREHYDDRPDFMIRRKDKTRYPTMREFEAIDYLCDEWDYAWEGINNLKYGSVRHLHADGTFAVTQPGDQLYSTALMCATEVLMENGCWVLIFGEETK